MKKIYLLTVLFCATQINAQCWKTVSAENKHVVAIKDDQSLWTWGANASGQLGDNTTVSKNTPTQVGIGSSWCSAAAGFEFTVAIKCDGSLWTWGNNAHGQLGDGTTINKIAPIRIGTANDWSFVSAGEEHVVALKNDGTLWQWGVETISFSGEEPVIETFLKAPKQIGAEINWSGAQIVAGGYHSLAVMADGTLWGWGNNSLKQLGTLNQLNFSEPNQIGSDTDWKFVSAGTGSSFGIKKSGGLLGWGANEDGRIGTGTTYSPITMVSIGNTLKWKYVEGGNTQTIAITTGGAVYSWGKNSYGQFGDGTTSNTPILSPRLILTDPNIVSVTSGDAQNYILSTTEGLAASGDNFDGALGDGTNDTRETFAFIPCPTTTVLGVNDFSKNSSLSLYPNPAKDILFLDLDDTAAAYEIFDVSGKRITSEKLGKKEINVSALSKGIYLLKVVTTEGTLNAKFIKE